MVDLAESVRSTSAASVTVLRSRVLPRWLGVSGLAVSALDLLKQGDIVAIRGSAPVRVGKRSARDPAAVRSS